MKQIKVWDLAVRAFHWTLGLLVLGAFLTSDEDETVPVHTRIGIAVVGLVVFRLAWGFLGTPHARFRDFVRSPREVVAYALDFARGRPRHHLGHNPLGGAMVVAMLALLAVTTLTGLVTYLGPEWAGPLAGVLTKSGAHAIKEVHEAAAWALPWLIGLHVAGVLVSSLLEKQNLVRGMVTGYKRAPDGVQAEPPRRPIVGFLAAALLGVAVALGLAALFPEGRAEAATPNDLLDAYAAEARAAKPSFTKFDATAGRALYATEHAPKGEPVSCATCHTSDPRQSGRSPAGKVIEPLAPGANSERFTDRAKADKWFDRNCKQVLGRVCTAEEKGHFLTYLLAP